MVVTALATLTLLSAASPPAQKLVVLELDAPGMIGLAGQVTQAVIDEAKRQKLSVIGPDDVLAKLGPKGYRELVQCGNKAACVLAGLIAFPEANRVVSGTLSRDEKAYLLHLTLTDLKANDVVTEVNTSILIASRRFQHDVQSAIPPFLRGEKEQTGTLVVSCNAKNASVTVNGEFIGVAPVTMQIKPGKHEVKVEQPKYLPATRLVGVEPNQTTTADIRLILKPGEKAEDEVPKLAGSAQPGADQGSNYFPSGQVWAVGAGAVALLGVATYFALTETGTEKTLRDGFNPITDTYAGTRKQALQAQQDALLANVFWGIGGAAAVVTAVLIYFDVKSQSASVQVAPTASPTGAGVSLTGRF
jgi:hypothetical protein